ncbi:hypothetical protein BV898_14616 [Hypsibius exemplaris]|uniref:Uncharacterized protein n=1 Tax=Hypsibius exemplaris TaxID=2072580 RepID=A0A9X6RJQ5_HYPEX|nr:hypothetical protein BV898_14616 [Hypsibius exemplaris]
MSSMRSVYSIPTRPSDFSLIGPPPAKLVRIRSVITGILGRDVEPFHQRSYSLNKNCAVAEFNLMADQVCEDQYLGCLELEDSVISQKW